jgi:hypothetical protein
MDNSRRDNNSYAVDIQPLNELYTLELNKNQALLNLRSQMQDHSPGGNTKKPNQQKQHSASSVSPSRNGLFITDREMHNR